MCRFVTEQSSPGACESYFLAGELPFCLARAHARVRVKLHSGREKFVKRGGAHIFEKYTALNLPS